MYFVTPRGQGGQVKVVNVKEGDRVNKGQLLLKLDDAVIRQQIEQEKIRLSSLQDLYQRRKTEEACAADVQDDAELKSAGKHPEEAAEAMSELSAFHADIKSIREQARSKARSAVNAAMVERLAKIDAVYGLSAMLVLGTGLARVFWGVKGSGWYWANPLLYVKLGMFAAIGLLSIRPTLQFLRWRKALRAAGTLPDEVAVRQVRRLVMVQAHLIPVVPLAAVFLARGYGG